MEIEQSLWTRSSFKKFDHDVDGKRNGGGEILKEETDPNVLELKRASDGMMGLKLEGVTANVVSGDDPQLGFELENDKLWRRMDEGGRTLMS